MRTFPLAVALLTILPIMVPAQVMEATQEFTLTVEPPEACGGDPVVYTALGSHSHLISAADAAECRFRIEVRGGAGGTPTGTGKNASGGAGAVITFDYEASAQTELRLHVGGGRRGLFQRRRGERRQDGVHPARRRRGGRLRREGVYG